MRNCKYINFFKLCFKYSFIFELLIYILVDIVFWLIYIFFCVVFDFVGRFLVNIGKLFWFLGNFYSGLCCFFVLLKFGIVCMVF